MFAEILTNSVGILFHPVFFLILAIFKNESLAHEKDKFYKYDKTCTHTQHAVGCDWRTWVDWKLVANNDTTIHCNKI